MKNILPVLLLASSLQSFAGAAQAYTGKFSAEVDAIPPFEVTEHANPMLRGAHCKFTVYLDGIVSKTQTDQAFSVSTFRWLDNSGPQQVQGGPFGMGGQDMPTKHTISITVPLGGTGQAWAQIQILQPEPRFSNRAIYTVHCQTKPKAIPLKPGTFPCSNC